MPSRIYHSTRHKKNRSDMVNYPNRDEFTHTHYGPHGKIIEKSTAVYKNEKHFTPNEENGAWETTFSYHGFVIRHSLTEDRYFLFYGRRDDQIFLTELSKLEQYELSKKWLQSIGGFEERCSGVHNGKHYTAMVLKLESKWKRENE